jgi:hypothetical protein
VHAHLFFIIVLTNGHLLQVEMSAAHDQLVLRAKKAEVEEALNAAAHAFDHHGLQLALGTRPSFAFQTIAIFFRSFV